MYLSSFLFLSELGTCLQNLVSTRGVEYREKYYFPQGGMLKFTYKGNFFFYNKKDTKNYYIENPNGKDMLWCLFYIQKS
jgi:hypothetical protein